MEYKRTPHLANPLLRLVRYGLVGSALVCLPLAFGSAIANVNIGDFFFSPTAVTINVNDQVKWTWIGSIGHSTTSNTGLWDSGVRGNQATFTNKFTSAGSFPFHCTVHPFMIGSITVQAEDVPPSVAITNPSDGSVLAAPAVLTLTASASDSDGSVTNVQFFQGVTSLGNITKAPSSVSVNNLASGDYALSAVASDNSGVRPTNSLTIHVVTPVAVALSSPNRVSATIFQFRYTANPGLSYLIQRSANLQDWTPISTNTAPSSPTSFSDNAAVRDVNFYRVQLLPNP